MYVFFNRESFLVFSYLAIIATPAWSLSEVAVCCVCVLMCRSVCLSLCRCESPVISCTAIRQHTWRAHTNYALQYIFPGISACVLCINLWQQLHHRVPGIVSMVNPLLSCSSLVSDFWAQLSSAANQLSGPALLHLTSLAPSQPLSVWLLLCHFQPGLLTNCLTLSAWVSSRLPLSASDPPTPTQSAWSRSQKGMRSLSLHWQVWARAGPWGAKYSRHFRQTSKQSCLFYNEGNKLCRFTNDVLQKHLTTVFQIHHNFQELNKP